MERFDGIGTILPEQAVELALVGPPARACGLEIDVRLNHPFGPYRFMVIPMGLAPEGDVHSRAFVRWIEIQRSIAFIRERLENMPGVSTRTQSGPVRANSLVVSLIEGWRGEVCHVAVTGADGKFLRYKITDPSFHNWCALGLSMRNQAISDFPICNKSFNLSYCGHDL
jgi:Ni,Fe-hydrogenase III large subunit